MQVCYEPESSRRRPRAGARARRPLRGCGRDRRRRAVRRSGDRGVRLSCSTSRGRCTPGTRPASCLRPRSTGQRRRRSRDGGLACTRARGRRPRQRPARAGRRESFVLEANPRASRTAPFASKAIGINLVEAACRLAADAPVQFLDLPRDSPEQFCVKVTCCRSLLSRGRPGARARDALDRRGHGEARSRPDRSREGRACRGRPLPSEGTAFLSVRDADKPAVIEIARFCRASASASSPRLGPSHARGSRYRRRARPQSDRGGGGTVVDLVRRGHCALVVNTPFGGSGARSEGYLIREAALAARVPCITTIAGARAAVRAIAEAQGDLAARCRSASVRSRARPRSSPAGGRSLHAAPPRAWEPRARRAAVLHDRGAWTPPTEADEPLHRPGREPLPTKPSARNTGAL